MVENFKTFNAKILLFGEYTVIFDSKALSVPYTYFSGQLSFIGENKYTRYDKAVLSNKNLNLLFDHYLKHPPLKERCGLDLETFRNDLDRGIYFESNIPQGYGVGSSGALIAALYHQYCDNPVKPTDNESILKLKEIFSLMESYFHGTSSGMDPLNCYIGKPLLFEGKETVHTVKVPHTKNNADGAVFLLNSGYPGATEPLVKLFLSKTRDERFRGKLNEVLIPLTNDSIEKLISGDIIGFFSGLNDISEFQYNYFKEMIPENFLPVWKKGLESGDYHLKLCGSGGGGFLLGFTTDYALAERNLGRSGIDIIPVFKNSNFRK